MIIRRLLFTLAVFSLALAAGDDRKPLEFSVRWVNPGSNLPRGVTHKTLLSKAMGQEVGFHLYLPPNYEASQDRYPVLYWLHGAGSDETAGLPYAAMLDRAIQSGPSIAIGSRRK